jgi:hypothetical protein
MKQLSFLLFCLIGAFFFTNGQQRFGGNKQAEKWKQINEGGVRVIFPIQMDSVATRVAAISELLKNTTSATIGSQQQKINIVLQPFTTVSNAYVGLGPFRSEFFMTPRQNSFELGALPWADNLVIHEYRHVQQFNNFNVGLSNLVGILFGENGRALANSVAVPNWFWEGDAVYQETLVSEQGRGRLSFFYNDFRALWQANKKYDWMKLRNGSLRDFVPDHYRLGYLQVAYGRQQYGNDFWRKVTRDAASFKGLFYPFQKAVKKQTGIRYSTFTTAALTHYKKQYSDTLLAALRDKHFVADREFPAYAADNAMVYVKSSYKQVPAFVELRNGVERKIRTRDVSLDNQFSYKKGKIVYASYRPDKRWSWNDYSELQLLDIATGHQQTITHKTKYFSPDISDNGTAIIAVDVKPGGNSTLHILNAAGGIVEKILPNHAKYFYTYPKWINDTFAVAAVRDTRGQMALLKINTGSGEAQPLTPFSWRIIGFPMVKGDSVYFTASNGADDLVCAYLLSTNKIYELGAKNKAIGIYQPTVSGNELTYASFTANGYMLKHEDMSELPWRQITEEEWVVVHNKFSAQLYQADAKNILSVASKKAASASGYSKAAHLFNFHSLYPLVNDPEYSLSAIGENILNTLQSELLFTYNRNEKFKQAGFNAVYGQWFPHITLGANYNFDRSDLWNDSTRIYWNEAQLITGISVPLNLSKGRSYTRLNAGSNLIYNKPSYRGIFKDSVQDGSFGYLNNFIVFSHQVQQARQHIFPRLAQTISINYRNGVIRRTARQLNANAGFYFPGLHVNHNFVINLAIGLRDSLRQISFSNSFPFSRGYSAQNLYRMGKWAVNYHFPICYPDKGLGNIIYLLRVRANAFYDHTIGNVAFRNNQTNQLFRRDVDFRSAGTEIFFDTKWWNELPISFGIRYSRLLDTDLFGTAGKNRFELILPLNLIQR